MDGYEATRIVFPRIQKLDPENASKIMNLLLSQDHGEKEMIRLASGPESLVHSMIVKARKDLGLPSNSPSPFLLPALTVYEPHNPMRPNNNLVMRKVVINPDGFLGPKHIEEIADETNPAASLDTTQPPNTTADDFEDLEDLKFTVSTVSQLRFLPPKLRRLTIEGCVYLEALPHDFLGRIPTLQEFYLISCPSLTSFHYSASLTTLYICDCISFEFPPSLEHKHPSLHRLYIGRSCVSLTTLPLDLFSELKTICIWNCLNLTSFDFTGEFRGTLESLEILEIRDCPRLSSFPDKGLNAPNLTSIVLSNCTDLNKLPNSMNSLTSLKTLILRGCPEIQSFPCGGLPSSLFFLTIIDCDKLTPQEDWGLHRLESLRRFVLQGGCMGMESFPEEKLLPSNIITLCISKLQSLKKLDYKGFQHLKSLHKLEIHCCDILRSLPEQRLPSSLKFLHVQECPLLTESLKPERGKEWHKVAHIPYLQIDDLVLSSDNWSVKAI